MPKNIIPVSQQSCMAPMTGQGGKKHHQRIKNEAEKSGNKKRGEETRQRHWE